LRFLILSNINIEMAEKYIWLFFKLKIRYLTQIYYFKVSLAVPNIRNINFGIVISQESSSDDHQTPDIKVSR
jgi:hypothetical protein